MRLLATAATVVAAPALAACGSSASTTGSAAQTTAASSTATSRSSTATTAATTTVTATVSATTPDASVPLCVAADLSLSVLGQQGAMGHGELGLGLRNISGKSCHTFGYPGILFLGQLGQPLPTVPTRVTRDYFGQTSEVALVVAPGASVSFRLGVTHGLTSSAGCTTAYGLQVIPPDDTATLRTTIPQGAYECQTATVSPLRAGASAYP